MENKYWKTKMYQTILIILLIGSLNWGTTALGYNFVEIIKNLLNNSLKTETYIDKIIYFLVALAGITLAMNRDLWSPCIEDFSNTRPSAPRLITAYPGNQSVKLTWSASTNAISYKIKALDISNNSQLFADTNNLSYTFTGLTNGRSYSFIVVGRNRGGTESNPSNMLGPIIPSVPVSNFPNAPVSNFPNAPVSNFPNAPVSNFPNVPLPTANLPIISIPEPIMYLNPDSTNYRKNVTIKFYSDTAKIYIDRGYGDFKLFSDVIGTINPEPNLDGYVILAANNGLDTIRNGEGIISIIGYNSSPINRLVYLKLVDGLKYAQLSFEVPAYQDR